MYLSVKKAETERLEASRTGSAPSTEKPCPMPHTTEATGGLPVVLDEDGRAFRK